MRVNFVLPSLNMSGGIRIVHEHARILQELGHRVTIISKQNPPPSRTKHFLRQLRHGKLDISFRITPKIPETHIDVSGQSYGVHVFDGEGPIPENEVPDADVILVTWWETAEWVANYSSAKGIKINFMQGHEIYPWLPADRIHAVWRLPYPKIVVSEWLRSVASQLYGDDNARLVPNGIQTDLFSFSSRLAPSRLNTIGTMASNTSRASFKRFWLAAETVSTLRDRGRPCSFKGFGTKWLETNDQLPAGFDVCYSPTQSEIVAIYGSCDCWLFTSDKEGYGLPILEAMSCGTPVVATRAGAAPELLASGGGILVDSDDPADLADAVEYILSLDDASWRAMSLAARAEAEKHSWSHIGGRMEESLKQILTESRRLAD